MSVLQYPETINVLDLQVWDNAAFDNREEEGPIPITDSWSSMQSISVTELESLEMKENQSPGFSISPVCEKSPIPIKPLHPNNTTGNLKGKPLKVLFKQGLLPPSNFSDAGNEVVSDDNKIDSQIEEIEMEISRLSSKLELLRVEKSLRDSMKAEVPAPVLVVKSVGPKQSSRVSIVPRKIEGTPANSRRRGVTMGPSEILAGMRSQPRVKQEMTTPIQPTRNRRGISLGPSEILAGVGSQKRGKQEISLIPSTQQNRRKSCFMKLQEINEGKVAKERVGGRSSSLSPKSRILRIQASRQGFTTAGSKKPVKKDDRVISSIQPKKLFKEGEKIGATRKPTKVGRVVASRYNQVSGQNTGNLTEATPRKMSLPGNDRGENKKSERKRASSVGKSRILDNQVAIPSEEMGRTLAYSHPPSILKVADLLPKIRIARSTNESPRDSGPAKKVVELIGKKSYFATEEDVETSVCQALSFDDQEE